jgi:hypothetical protein
MKYKRLPLETKRKQRRQQQLTLALLLVPLLGLFIVTTTTVLNTTPDVLAQTATSSEAEKKKDIFKVIMTVQGLDHNSGDIVTIISVNGESRVKLFDDTKTYIHSVNANGTGGLIEYVAAFPNMTVNVGDEYKVCALTIKDSNLICQTGTNSPALRPEFKDLYLQEEKPTTSQAATLGEEEEE